MKRIRSHIKPDFDALLSAVTDARDLRGILRERLPERILGLLHIAGEVADRLGLQAYVVGGFVRDLLMAAGNFDVDIVVEGDGIRFARNLAERLGGKSRSHQRFGTAKIMLPNGLRVDVATARTEYYARPAALPEVKATILKDDLLRRDFSINAMALRIGGADFGRVVDYFGGVKDLRSGTIRVLHALSFADDPTRIFRAVRFEQRYGFTIDPNTEHYLRDALKAKLVGRLSLPRIFAEFMRILDEEQPQKPLRRLGQLGVSPWIHPSLKSVRKVLTRLEAIRESLAFTGSFIDRPVDRRLVYLLGVLEHLTLAQTRAVARDCHFPRRLTKALIFYKKYGEAACEKFRTLRDPRPSRISALFRGFPREVLLYLMAKHCRHRRVVKGIRDYITRWQTMRPLLSGRDLKKLGYVPGPRYDEILSALLAQRLDGNLLSRQDEVDFLEKKYPLTGKS